MGEKLLFGFEPAEIEAAARNRRDAEDAENVYRVLEDGEILFFRLQPHHHEREMLHIRPMHCVKGRCTQGEYACRVVEVVDHQVARAPSLRLPRIPVLELHRATPQANLRLPELFNTSGWFHRALPRDWSGWDLLRIDVLLENQEAERLLLEVEDDLVEPPVSVTFAGPPLGRWVTLELDLGRAVRERGLDLAAMNNVWVRMELKDAEARAREMHSFAEDRAELEKRRFVAWVDNLRLCTRGTPAAHPVLAGERSGYTLSLPRSYAAEEHFIEAGFRLKRDYWPSVTPAAAALPGGAPAPAPGGGSFAPFAATVPIAEMIARGCLADEPENAQIHSNIRLTCTAAFDARRMAVGFDIYGTGALRAGPTADRIVGNNACAAVRTLDGGASWKGLGGAEWPSVLGGNQSKVPPRLQDLGGDLMSQSAFGCLAVRGPHMGYPGDRTFFSRTVFRDGDWRASPNFFVTGEPRHCHWLWWGDVLGTPAGRIWMAWEVTDRRGYEDDSSYSVFAYRSDDGGVTWQSWRGAGFNGGVPPFGSQRTDMHNVRLAPYRDGIAVFGGHHWTWFDGRRWAVLRRTDAIPWQVVSCGDEIYIADESGPVMGYDGRSWSELNIPGRRGLRGRLSVCGGESVVLVEPDQTGRRLLAWRKKPGAPWRGPEELAVEPTRIVQLTAQRHAPRDFVPVAYMCLSPGEEGKLTGGERTRATPGNQHYHGTPFRRLYWTYPVDHFVQEPWIRVVGVAAE